MRITEREIIQRLQRAGDQYAPLIINRLEEQVSLPEGYRVGAVIEFSIQNGPSFEAVVEIASVAAPQNILKRAVQLADYFPKVKKPNMVPLVIAPYIGAKQAKILADKGISWVDLSGNMSIRVSNRIYIERTGKPNRFPDTTPIKKIFQGTSALVSRALLLKPDGFESVNDICNFINARNANITLSTVSKVLKTLDEELLVNRGKSLVSVADPNKLLGGLVQGYKNSTERKKRKEYRFAIDSVKGVLREFTDRAMDYVACGFCAAQIKGLAVTDQTMIFVRDMEQVQRARANNWIKISPDVEFGNLSITETSDPGVWFSTIRSRPYEPVVDDIELYLEMTVDTPRGPRIAEQLKRRILQKGGSDGQKSN
jgi:hypothetical protein